MDTKIIMGIDPGLVHTGWSILTKKNYDDIKYIDSGIINTSNTDPLGERLSFIYNSISNIIDRYNPSHIAMEEVFVNMNPKSSRKLIMARSASFIACSNKKYEVYEYMPNAIKKSITGLGHASKNQVYVMIQKILNVSLDLTKFPSKTMDSIDALCHAFNLK